jgi:Na+/phosphate symporter
MTLAHATQILEALGQLQTAVIHLSNRLDTLDAKIDESIAKLDAKIDESIVKLDAKVALLDAKIALLDAKIDKTAAELYAKIHLSQQEVTETITDLSDAISAHSITFETKMDARITSHESRIKGLEQITF